MYDLWIEKGVSKKKAKELTESIFQFFNIYTMEIITKDINSGKILKKEKK